MKENLKYRDIIGLTNSLRIYIYKGKIYKRGSARVIDKGNQQSSDCELS